MGQGKSQFTEEELQDYQVKLLSLFSLKFEIFVGFILEKCSLFIYIQLFHENNIYTYAHQTTTYLILFPSI